MTVTVPTEYTIGDVARVFVNGTEVLASFSAEAY